jgi:hypothetical protein
MPYELFKKDGKFCVRNKETKDNKGCSETRSKAVAHMRALYAAEAGESLGKEINDLDPDNWTAVEAFVDAEVKAFEEEYGKDETEEVLDEKAMSEKSFFGATSYAELEEMEEARERTQAISDLIYEFPYLASNILDDPFTEDKEKAITDLASELSTRISTAKKKELLIISEGTEVPEEVLEGITNVEDTITRRAKEKAKEIVKTLFSLGREEDAETEDELMIWKEKDGSYHWFARYSNNRRDRDNPPEIISEKSHRRFVELVDKGLAPYPELLLWHIPKWKIGQAYWVGYDDTGFALSAGKFDKGCEPVAEWLKSKTDVLVSHGMPPSTIKRDKEDDSIIIEHESREISPLPDWAAANELTGFIALNKEAKMAIPEAKKQSLIDDWGMSPEIIATVEALNAETAREADEKGIERKEKTGEVSQGDEQPEATTAEATEETTTTDAVDEETTVETEETEQAKEADEETSPEEDETPEATDALKEYATKQETVDALEAVIIPVLNKNSESIETISEIVKALVGKVEQLESTDTEKVKEQVENSTLATLTALLQKSVIRDEETKVDGRESPWNRKPKETSPDQAQGQPTPVPIVNTMLLGGDPAEQTQ